MSSITAAVMTAPGRSELRALPPPDLREGALLQIEACGICPEEPALYRRADLAPAILGHRIVGTTMTTGARVVVDVPVPCRACAFCARGEFRLCAAAQRYGTTRLAVAPGLWGGFATHLYLHPRAVVHAISAGVPAAIATLAQVLADAVQEVEVDGRAGAGRCVLVLGSGVEGLCAAFVARHVGAQVIAASLAQERRRRAAAEAMRLSVVGADSTLPQRVMDLTGGRGADLVIDTTPDTSGQVGAAAIACAASGGMVLLEGRGVMALPLHEMRRKNLALKTRRGHSDAALARAVELLEERHGDFAALADTEFSLKDVDAALRASKTADALHVCVRPSLSGG